MLVLPSLPSIENTFDQTKLEQLVKDFVNSGPSSWLDRNITNDTYWSGKAYGKVAELIAISKSIGLNNEANQLTVWLKSELEDWFTAETNGVLDEQRYFVYDDQWDTLLGMEEAYGSHTRLADHHFHYGYFVRAAAEICRTDKSWCSSDQYGPMIELLIRDYAAEKMTMSYFLRIEILIQPMAFPGRMVKLMRFKEIIMNQHQRLLTHMAQSFFMD